MTTTTYGYRRPATGDKAKGASGWMQAFVFNIDRFDGHNHDGSNSPQLPMSSLTPYTQSVASASWGNLSNGVYRQDKTVPTGVTDIDNYHVTFIFSNGTYNEVAYLRYERLTATTYRVYCNDNTKTFTAVFR